MKRLLIVALGFAFVVNAGSDVRANPLAGAFSTLVMNQVVALVTQKAAQRDGISPDDARLNATYKAMERVATEHAETSLSERMFIAAGAPTWFGLATTLLGAQLGEIVVGKMGNTDVTVSSLPAGAIQVKRTIDIPNPDPPKPYVPPPYPPIGAVATEGPWEAMSIAGARIYRDSSCRKDEVCAKFPKEPWSSINALHGWYWSRRDDMTVIARSRPQLEEYFRIFMAAKLRINGITARNVRVRIADELNADGVPVRVKAYRSYEYEKCEQAQKTVLDLTKSGCPDDAKNSPNAIEWPACTNKVTEDVCTWQAAPERDGFADGLWPQYIFPDESETGRYGPQERVRTYNSLDEAYAGLSDKEKELSVSPKLVADVANALAHKASQQKDYRGVPYRLTSPITPQDVKEWVEEKGRESLPRLIDVFSRPTPAYERVVPIHVTITPDRRLPESRVITDGGGKPTEGDRDNTKDGQSRDVNVVNTPSVQVTNPIRIDAGPAPVVAAPSLESPPTPGAILAPILNLLPDFKGWRTPSHAATCPRPVFDVFQTRIRMDAMCDIAERHRKTIRTVMLAVFVLIALTILLAA
ncbi:hypothetical protein PCO31111_03963 [Pandoraea communis]|uniref:Uncharacterized protein n=1 Tax=Pandoraea communis TaxID=2508297 RepID=A0A5E4XLA4_9BURK|nr:hypothetical protein [Pandoraea communis]VVE37076.1 hypothetical protein PCO31111_03963 [Pandoraea communis]